MGGDLIDDDGPLFPDDSSPTHHAPGGKEPIRRTTSSSSPLMDEVAEHAMGPKNAKRRILCPGRRPSLADQSPENPIEVDLAYHGRSSTDQIGETLDLRCVGHLSETLPPVIVVSDGSNSNRSHR